MGIRLATTLLLGALSILACGRRGDPIRPDGQIVQPPLSIQYVGRAGPDGLFSAATTAEEVWVDIVPITDFHCGSAQPTPLTTVRATGTQATPGFFFALPLSTETYIRILSAGSEPSRWVYVAPATAVLENIDLVLTQYEGFVTLATYPVNSPFVLEEQISQQWRYFGRYTTTTTLGPYPPDTIVSYRIRHVKPYNGSLVYSPQSSVQKIKIQ